MCQLFIKDHDDDDILYIFNMNSRACRFFIDVLDANVNDHKN